MACDTKMSCRETSGPSVTRRWNEWVGEHGAHDGNEGYGMVLAESMEPLMLRFVPLQRCS